MNQINNSGENHLIEIDDILKEKKLLKEQLDNTKSQINGLKQKIRDYEKKLNDFNLNQKFQKGNNQIKSDCNIF